MDAVYFRTGGWFAIQADGAESGAFLHEHELWIGSPRGGW